MARARVIEGIDFSDHQARAVFIIGVPNTDRSQCKIKIKMDHLDQKKGLSGSKHALSGNEWYNDQTIKAMNQAIGRVIRHS